MVCLSKQIAANFANKDCENRRHKPDRGKLLSFLSSENFYALSDANKNITEYINVSGNVHAYFEYSPFGKITVASGLMPDAFDYRFSSEYFDQETGLVYYNFRYYSPELGRWLSRDPIEDIGNLTVHALPFDVDIVSETSNPYRHTRNNLISYIDTDGRFVAAIIAIVVGGIIVERVIDYKKRKTLQWIVEACQIKIFFGEGAYILKALKEDKIKAPYPSSGTIAVCCESNKIMKPVREGGDLNYPKLPNVIPGSIGTDKNLVTVPEGRVDITEEEPFYKNYNANLVAARARAKEICKDTKLCCKQVKITSVLADTVYPFFSAQPGYSGEEIIDCNRSNK